MPGPKPGALPAWRPPSAFGFKSSGPALLPINIVKTDSRRNAIEALSRRIEQSDYSDRTAALLYRTMSRRTCPDFDFSSLRAGTAMLLMLFFAVNAPPPRPCTAPRQGLDSSQSSCGFAVQGFRRDYCGERRAPPDSGRRSLGGVGGVEHAKDGAAAA